MNVLKSGRRPRPKSKLGKQTLVRCRRTRRGHLRSGTRLQAVTALKQLKKRGLQGLCAVAGRRAFAAYDGVYIAPSFRCCAFRGSRQVRALPEGERCG